MEKSPNQDINPEGEARKIELEKQLDELFNAKLEASKRIEEIESRMEQLRQNLEEEQQNLQDIELDERATKQELSDLH